MRLKDKNAIVTGAGQGIGKSIALKMAQEGADVAIVEWNPVTGVQTQKEIKALGRRCLFFAVDVADRRQIEKMMAEVLQPSDGLIFWSIMPVLIGLGIFLKRKRRIGMLC